MVGTKRIGAANKGTGQGETPFNATFLVCLKKESLKIFEKRRDGGGEKRAVKTCGLGFLWFGLKKLGVFLGQEKSEQETNPGSRIIFESTQEQHFTHTTSPTPNIVPPFVFPIHFCQKKKTTCGQSGQLPFFSTKPKAKQRFNG